MWRYHNPVAVTFGVGSLETLAARVAGRSYLLVTYPDTRFAALAEQVSARLGPPVARVSDVAPNPDLADLDRQTARVAQARATAEVVLAVGGGSVIDSAKVLAAAGGGEGAVEALLAGGEPPAGWRPLPLIAVPTTAGTGSEVTSWATVWDRAASTKRSLDHPRLYPEAAVIDPALMCAMPRALTISTGLDALSHALESLWNRHINPISAMHAVAAARTILEVLPALACAPDDLDLRRRMAQAALSAGLAFSGTRTAIAHAISYPVTLHHGVPHGIACSFTLPMILHGLADADGLTGWALREIFGPDLRAGAWRLAAFLEGLDVHLEPADYGIGATEWSEILAAATAGDRGRNFIATAAAVQPLPPRPSDQTPTVPNR
ncbi:MAG: iron-containing alcohol dehydrogenase [Geminicoccaceae bacterium]|nr:MAG: iron-containing alcohol dehydrogenase [Geminicoccaceae bacterium]